MAGSRVPGSIDQRPIDAGTSVLAFSPVQGPTGGPHDTHRPDGAVHPAVVQAQAKDASRGSPSKALPGTGIRLQITIDDAPFRSATNDAMLDLLDKYKIKTMFFVEGEYVHARPKDLLKIAARGHRLGLHTWDHPRLTRLSDDKIKEQFTRTDNEVKKLTGKSMAPHWRPPYGDGFRDARVLRIAASVGFTKMWFWDIDPKDTDVVKDRQGKTRRSPAEMTKLITDNMEQQLTALAKNPQIGREGEKGKYVVLFHDIPTTVTALEVLLPRLKNEGYSFVDFP